MGRYLRRIDKLKCCHLADPLLCFMNVENGEYIYYSKKEPEIPQFEYCPVSKVYDLWFGDARISICPRGIQIMSEGGRADLPVDWEKSKWRPIGYESKEEEQENKEEQRN